jgi:hypothetical protein
LKDISSVLDPIQFVLEFLFIAGRGVSKKLILDYSRFQETFNFLKDLKKDKIIVNEFNRHLFLAHLSTRSFELLTLNLSFEGVNSLRDQLLIYLRGPLRREFNIFF